MNGEHLFDYKHLLSPADVNSLLIDGSVNVALLDVEKPLDHVLSCSDCRALQRRKLPAMPPLFDKASYNNKNAKVQHPHVCLN